MTGFYTKEQIMVLNNERRLLDKQRERLAKLVAKFTPKGKVHNQTCPIGVGRNGGSGEMPCPCGGYGVEPEPTLDEAYDACDVDRIDGGE